MANKPINQCTLNDKAKFSYILKEKSTTGRGKFYLGANAPCPVVISQRLEKEGILDMARGNVHFQQHAWGYFAFNRLLRFIHDRRKFINFLLKHREIWKK